MFLTMSYFLKKDQASCLSEIKAASDHISQIFNADMNLLKLKEQVDLLVEGKIESYLHQRFKDWSVADLILLSTTIAQQAELEGKTEQRSRKKG